MTPGVRREILNLPGVPERFSIFDDKAVRDVHDAYAGYSWVKEVRSIKKVYPNKLSMELVIRRPVVRVRDGNRYYLADAEGVRLSARHYDTDAALKLPYLYGMKEKIPAVGKKFAVEVAAGIEVVTVLASADFYDELDVTAIDLSNLGGRRSRTESEIVVWTATRAAITWGRSTAYAKFGELPVADKLKNLEKINGQRPGLRGLHTVRLEFDDVHYELR